MEWVETTGRSVEEAKEAALDQLGVDEQDAEFEIVEEARFGLFGRLRSEARVRARVRPTKPRPKEDRREQRGRRRSGAPGSAPSDESRESERRGAGTETQVLGGDASAHPGGSPVTSSDSPDDTAVGAAKAGATGSRSRRRGSGRGPGRTLGGAEPVGDHGGTHPDRVGRRDPAESDNESHATSPGGGMDVSLEDQAAVAQEFLEGLTGRMSLIIEVDINQPEDDAVELNLQGQDLGLLIGPKGATLLAIQDLTRTVVQRKTSAANGRILVDVAGYRRKRKDALARFSRQVAVEVQSTGSRRVLEPMSAADRKVVHDTVNQIEGVTTISEGEDPRRRVVIVPAPANN